MLVAPMTIYSINDRDIPRNYFIVDFSLVAITMFTTQVVFFQSSYILDMTANTLRNCRKILEWMIEQKTFDSRTLKNVKIH